MTSPNSLRRLTRRTLLRGMLGVALSGASLYGYTRSVEPRWLAVDAVTLPIAGLAQHLDGQRFAQLSDIHLSPYFSVERFAQALAQVHDANVEWLALTGDYVGRDAEAAAGLVEPLAALDIPVLAVFGNHDHWTQLAVVRKYLEAAGVRILLNDAVEMAAGFWVAGIDDMWSGRPDLRAALLNVPQASTALLLAHEPDYFDTVIQNAAPVVAQLSGHTHGGQVRLPMLRADETGRRTYAPVLPRYGVRYPIGLRAAGGRYVYTNRGLGVWPMPYRFNCRPELTVFTLRAA